MRFYIHEILMRCPKAYGQLVGRAKAGQVEVTREEEVLLTCCFERPAEVVPAHSFPPIAVQIKNAAGAAARVLGAALVGRSIVVPEDVQNARLALCRGCEHYLNGRCRKCGCRVAGIVAKTAWATERCPLSPPKWGSWQPLGNGAETALHV